MGTYLIRLWIAIRALPFIEPAIGCLEAAGARWNKQEKKKGSVARPGVRLAINLLGAGTRKDEVLHREFPITDGDDTELIPVRVPVERSDGTSVTGNLEEKKSEGPRQHRRHDGHCRYTSRRQRNTRTVVRVEHGGTMAVSNSKKTGFVSSPMTMHPSRGSSLPVKKISNSKEDMMRRAVCLNP